MLVESLFDPQIDPSLSPSRVRIRIVGFGQIHFDFQGFLLLSVVSELLYWGVGGSRGKGWASLSRAKRDEGTV